MKSEVETVICWSADDDRAEVYSLMPRIWRQCIAAGAEQIKLKEGIRDGKQVARTYLVPVKSVRIRKQRTLTAKQHGELRERGRAMAAAKMGLGPK